MFDVSVGIEIATFSEKTNKKFPEYVVKIGTLFFFLIVCRLIGAKIRVILALETDVVLKSNQGNQDSSRNQLNVVYGQRPGMENRYTQQKT